jgi:peroxiredoxin family protein/rhodanese-related sulfurtransferase/TusA-related sulfurtransferase
MNVLATAQRAGLTVEDLEHLELAYAPQWGGAKHPVNMAGFVAMNLLRGDTETFDADNVPNDLFILDVREPAEAEAGKIPGSTLISVDQLRNRYQELPKDRTIGVYCAVGLRGHIACRFLKQRGFRVLNLNGGFRSWGWWKAAKNADAPAAPAGDACCKSAPASHPKPPALALSLDVCGLQCPGPMAKVKESIAKMTTGETLEVVATDPGFAADIPAWCHHTGHQLIEVKPQGKTYVARIVKTESQPQKAETKSSANGKTIVCFSGDLDRVMATFVIANAAASMGSEVTIFFTFWGLNVLRKEHPPAVQKGLLDRMFGWMMPRGSQRLTLSKMHMLGMGTAMMKHVMRNKKVMSLPELIQSARDAGVKLVACSMSMDVMGIQREELIDGVEIGGATYYLNKAEAGDVNLFI